MAILSGSGCRAAAGAPRGVLRRGRGGLLCRPA